MDTRTSLAAIALAALALNATVAIAEPWATKCAKPQFTCINITVSSADKTITLEDPVPVKSTPFPQRIIWRLPEGYVFNKDGGKAHVPNHNNEFGEQGGVGDDGDTDEQEWTKRYKVKVKERLKESGGYKYTLIFHELNGGKATKKFTCDPVVANFDTTPLDRKGGKPRAAAAKVFTCTVE